MFLKSAEQLEGKGEHKQAQFHFEQAMRDVKEKRRPVHVAQCRAGVASTSIKLGDLSWGMDVARALKNPAFCRKCAQVIPNCGYMWRPRKCMRSRRTPSKAASRPSTSEGRQGSKCRVRALRQGTESITFGGTWPLLRVCVSGSRFVCGFVSRHGASSAG